ncbi:MAG: hypothetical protein HY232_10265, partial [Acidobacteria bacterium]|nr:hypothetical protein [Acidobacteriota bacterium]
VQKGLSKRETALDGTFGRTQIINSPKFMIAIRQENGTPYDGTAALNTKAAVRNLLLSKLNNLLTSLKRQDVIGRDILYARR